VYDVEVTDFRSIRDAALEGEYEPDDDPPEFKPRPRESAAQQIRTMQEAARARARLLSTLGGRYLIVGGIIAVAGFCWYGPPAPLRDVEAIVGVLLASRGLWCIEQAAGKRREASFDASVFLADADR
jgi:hypothetical protein